MSDKDKETCGCGVPLSEDCEECKEYLGDEYHSPNEEPMWECKECNALYSRRVRVCVDCSSGGRFANPKNTIPHEVRKELDEDLATCKLLTEAVNQGHMLIDVLGWSPDYRKTFAKRLKRLVAGEDPYPPGGLE